MMIADITERKTGKTVGVPVKKIEAELLKDFVYWRAYFFRLGCGVPGPIKHEILRRAKLGDYSVSLMRRGKVVFKD